MNPIKTSLCAAVLAASLSACGAAEGTSTDGAEVFVNAVPVGPTTAAASSNRVLAWLDWLIPVAQAHGDGATKTFRRKEGERIDLEQGTVNLLATELTACTGSAALGRTLLDWVIPTAQAHAGHGGEAPKGAFDAVGTADNAQVAMGTLLPPPGRYCGVKVLARPLASGDLAGKSIAVGPCFYAQSAGVPDGPANDVGQPSALTPHECWSQSVEAQSSEIALAFAQPLELSAAKPNAVISLKVGYRQWFDGLDMAALKNGDATQKAKLAGNVLASLKAEATQ